MYLGYLQDSFRQDKELFRNNIRWEWYKSESRAKKGRLYKLTKFMQDLNGIETFFLNTLYSEIDLGDSLYAAVCGTLVYKQLPEIHHSTLISQNGRGNRKKVPPAAILEETKSQTFQNDIDEDDTNSDFSVVSACSEDETFIKNFKSHNAMPKNVNEDAQCHSRLNITKQRVKKSVYAHIPKPFTVAEHTSQLKEIAVGLPIYMGLVSIALCGDPAKFKQLSLLTDEELNHRRCVYW